MRIGGERIGVDFPDSICTDLLATKCAANLGLFQAAN
jgi:hypothetical protein